jgi:hypothetical protein
MKYVGWRHLVVVRWKMGLGRVGSNVHSPCCSSNRLFERNAYRRSGSGLDWIKRQMIMRILLA